jgi:hypothetical protein
LIGRTAEEIEAHYRVICNRFSLSPEDKPFEQLQATNPASCYSEHDIYRLDIEDFFPYLPDLSAVEKPLPLYNTYDDLYHHRRKLSPSSLPVLKLNSAHEHLLRCSKRLKALATGSL